MVKVARNHYKTLATSQLACKIIFDKEFSSLYEELEIIYKNIDVDKPDQEAFLDAFYCILAQKETPQKVLSC